MATAGQQLQQHYHRELREENERTEEALKVSLKPRRG